MTVASALASLRRWLAPPPPEPPKPNVAARIERELDLDGLRALIAGMTPAPFGEGVNPFTPNFNPPTVVKEALSAKGLAFDSLPAAGVVDFARAGLAGIVGPREGFLGFPELAILSLRPEYRSPAEIIATESTRKWIKIKCSDDADKTAKVAKIEAEFERLNVQGVFRQISEHDALFGRAHLFVDVDGVVEGDELKLPIGGGSDELSKLKIGRGSLKELRAVEPVWVWPITYNSLNPLSPKWYRPGDMAVHVAGNPQNAALDLHFAGSSGPSEACLHVRGPISDAIDDAGCGELANYTSSGWRDRQEILV
jgi:hypothetical protein